MADFPLLVQKVVSSLPDVLTPHTIYLVRVGQGFDLYVTDSTGQIAHKINSPLIEIGGENLIIDSDVLSVGVAGNISNREALADGTLKIKGATNRFHSFYSREAETAMSKIKFSIGEPFIVSFWVKAVNLNNLPTEMPELYLSIDKLYKNDFQKKGNFENGDVQYIQHRIATSNSNLLSPFKPHLGFSANAVGGGIIITKWQIQKGDIATDWNPAHIDIENKINAKNEEIAFLQNKNQQLEQEIERIKQHLGIT